jgi:hypothetical protein
MLTLQFVPYAEIEGLSLAQKIKKLIDVVREDKIVVLEGRLKKQEEADLIKMTMEAIDEKFKGVEISVIYPESKSSDLMKKMKSGLASLLIGDRRGLTIIGPATIVKDIKKDPDKIQLLTEESAKRVSRKKRKRGKR